VADATGSMHGFPAVLTAFVGRAQVVEDIAGQLGEYRLVTVTGPGGAGKTRLAGEVAKQVAGRFADGVWLAELSAVRDPAQVAAVAAVALGIRDLPSVAAADALAHALAGRQLLLVLDNCEHVIGAAAELCGRLLLGADDVRVLATSREPLRIAGEVRYRLGPLTLPDPVDSAATGKSEAVTLFADRARRADPGFAFDETAQATVAQLVARLDGMPLAIELAAARVDALGVAQLLDRIDDRFVLLVDGDRLAEQRQRSLAAAVQWSYQLLDDFERRVFRAVSVFPGPFTLGGAEAVAGPGAGRVVPRLVDCSLLVPPRVGPDGRTRFAMLETLRAYGAGLLADAGEDGEVTAALAAYAAEVVEEASAGLYTRTREAASLRHLDAEDVTLRHALVWAMEHDPSTALRLALGHDPGGRGARRGDERGHRRRVRPHARHRHAGAAGRRRSAGRGTRPDQAQPPGTGTGHVGRAGPYRRADRGPAIHHGAHGQLAPGPDPGQDRLQAPRRPHPAGPWCWPRLSRPGLSPLPVRPPRRPVGDSTPAATRAGPATLVAGTWRAR